MIIINILLSFIFIGIGFLITERNAKYLLSGYNTMTDEDRKNFNLTDYLKFFKKFHVFLGTTLLIISLILFYFVDADYSSVFAGIYPVAAYIYFIWKGKRFNNMKDEQTKSSFIFALIIMVVVFVGIVGMFAYSLQDNPVEIKAEIIKIGGDYGIDLPIKDIKSIELVNELPEITLKINGFALQNIEKGLFRTNGGEKVKLLINSQNKPFILIITNTNDKIYYSSKEKSNQKIYNQLIKVVKK